MNIKNNKGFTLVELLAVIVILAVIILIASSNVGAMMTKARKNALAIEGNELVNSAKTAYQMAILDRKITSGSACFSLQYLYDNGYFSKGSSEGYTGSVAVIVNGETTTYQFWISNGSYVFGKYDGQGASVGASGSDDLTEGLKTNEDGKYYASSSCGSTGGQSFSS